MSDSHRGRYVPSLEDDRRRDQVKDYKADRKLGKTRSKDALRSEQIAKLREMKAGAIKAGAMSGALPEIHDQMSEADIAKAAQALGRYTAKPAAKPAAPAKPAAQPAAAASQPAAAKPAAAAAPVAATAAAVPAKAALAAPPAAAPPVVATPVATGTPSRASAMAGRVPIVSGPAAPQLPEVEAGPQLNPTAEVAPEAGVNPLEQLANDMKGAMVGSGTLAPGQSLMKTGAGYVTPALNPDGSQMVNPDGSPRFVAVKPTFDETMNAKTGGAFRGWSPEQRAAYFRAHPANSGMGVESGVVHAKPIPKPLTGFDGTPASDAANLAQNKSMYAPGGMSESPEAHAARVEPRQASAAVRAGAGAGTNVATGKGQVATSTIDVGSIPQKSVAGVSPAGAKNDINMGGLMPTGGAPAAAALTTMAPVAPKPTGAGTNLNNGPASSTGTAQKNAMPMRPAATSPTQQAPALASMSPDIQAEMDAAKKAITDPARARSSRQRPSQRQY